MIIGGGGFKKKWGGGGICLSESTDNVNLLARKEGHVVGQTKLSQSFALK